MKKVIIVGASSGIGFDLAKIFSAKGYIVGITARREEQLLALQKELPNKSFVKKMDVVKFDEAKQQLQLLITEMGGMDIIVLNAGIGWSYPTPQQEIDTIQVNVSGFVALGNFATEYFVQQGRGHIVGVSSIASIRGSHIATVYSASKAFISSYMEGLRIRFFKKKLDIVVTDIRPGFVLTPMTEKNKGMFWVATAEKAAQQIYDAIIARKDIAYITKRWAIIGFLYKLLPEFLLKRT
jgi:short-subunit dehydrogenase